MRRRRRMRVAPQPPTQPKLPKPQYRALKDIYKKLISANIANRLAAFFEALQWYDDAIKYFIIKSPLKPEQLKSYAIANKSRNLAIGAGTDQEKEAALLRTIALYEKIWSKEKIYSYEPYYKEYEDNKKKLEEKEQAIAARFQVILEALNTAFKPLNVEFVLVKQTNTGRPQEYDGAGKMLISKDLAKELTHKVKQEGLLPALFAQVKQSILAYGVEITNDPNAPGGIKHSPNIKKMMEGLPIALDGILQYVNTSPKGKIFKQYNGALEANVITSQKIPKVKVAKVVSANTTPKVKVHRAPRTSGNLVGGRYQAGSAMAELYLRLQDQKPHALSDLYKGLNVNNPADRMKYLIKHGQRSGNWHISMQGNVAQMTLP